MFFVTMLIVSAVGAFLAYIKSDISFSTALLSWFVHGLFDFYFVDNG